MEDDLALDEGFGRYDMAGTDNKILVEVGSGGQPQDGYIHCDIRPINHVEYVCKAWAIPFKAESVDEIYARHMLEHLTCKEAKRTLRHWLCVLKVGGRIDINVPDLEKHIKQLNMDGYSSYISNVTNKEHAMASIYGWENDEYDIHKWGYMFETLCGLLNKIGYGNVRRVEDNSISGPMNLRVIAEKDRAVFDLQPDPESLLPKWRYIHWNTFIRNLADKLGIKRYILAILRPGQSLIKILKKDYSGKGERQVSSKVDGIRPDHRGRYKFACRFINKNDTLLDCACGVGYGSFILAGSANSGAIMSVDRAEQAIKFASKHYSDGKITYKTGDIFSLDIPENHFDCIVSFETVEHVDDTALVKLFSRKLKNNGRLIISTPNQDTQPFSTEDAPFHLKHYTPAEFETLLTSGGFEIIGRFTQFDRISEDVSEGWNGLFNIAVARKQQLDMQ
jgi:predicted SAM-dependent methyltransferase/2-polyprenyl-3-methyl-5-hydroxy-6-metoxy-1,4-benzoquinol methylase